MAIVPPLDERSDSDLMAALARGEAEALGEIYARYGRMIYSVILRHAPGLGRAELEDLTQDALLTFYDTAPRYREQGKMRAWLCAVAAGKARDYRRKTWVRRNLLGRIGYEQAGDAQHRDAQSKATTEARLEIDRALRELPEGQRQVLLLNTLEDMGGEEIAVALGISAKTVWTRLHRARQALQQTLRSTGNRRRDPRTSSDEGDR